MDTSKKIIMQKQDEKIIEVCAISCQVPNIMERSRHRDYVIARQMAWKIMHEHFGYTLVKIGCMFKKDHSTIISGIRVINNCLHVKDVVVMQRWNYVMQDEEIQRMIFGQDKRISLLIPSFISTDEFMDHVRSKYPDCAIS